MAVHINDLHRFFKKYVTLQVDTCAVKPDVPAEKDENDPHLVVLEGKILAVSADGVAIRIHGNTQIIQLDSIISCVENPRIRKKRVVKRWVRVIPVDASVKQHLADRHGILVSVLNAVDEQTARLMHDNISHTDLGHRHRSAEDRIRDLETPGTQEEFAEDDELE